MLTIHKRPRPVGRNGFFIQWNGLGGRGYRRKRFFPCAGVYRDQCFLHNAVIFNLAYITYSFPLPVHCGPAVQHSCSRVGRKQLLGSLIALLDTFFTHVKLPFLT